MFGIDNLQKADPHVPRISDDQFSDIVGNL
jgi:hypothetical protein